MKRLLFSVFTVLLLSVGKARADTVDDGLAAFKRGDYSEAVRLYRLAAAQGNEEAQYRLGTMHEFGHGVTQDYAKAFRWYRLSAAQGGIGVHVLGEMYYEGHGVAQDYLEADKWFRLAAAKGNSRAQFFLGLMYDFGQGVTQNYAEAIKPGRLS